MSVIPNSLALNIIENSHSKDDLESLLQQVADLVGGVSWRHVGHTDSDPNINNAGTCEVANDKRAPVMELIFNGIDSAIELAHMITPFDAPSPHAAVKTCSLLHNEEWTTDRVCMNLYDSGMLERPTIDIRDTGHGQHPNDFPSTFLSLHSSSKRSVPYLCGKFGMGMKSAFRYCDRVLIASRRHPEFLDGRPDHTGITVIRRRFSEGDSVLHYDYLCDSAGGIIRAKLPDSMFSHGTLVRLVRYNLEGYHGGICSIHNSLRRLLNSYLVDPPIGVWIHDNRRQWSKKDKNRRPLEFCGLKHALDNPKVPNSHEEHFVVKIPVSDLVSSLAARGDTEEPKNKTTVPDSEVRVHYYVLGSSETSEDKMFTRVELEQGITFVHNGQRHGAEPRTTFKTRFGLGNIRNRLVVVVDTSDLHPVACSDLYSSNRISVNPDSAVYKAVINTLGSFFAADTELQTLDHEETSKRHEDASANTESLEQTVKAFVADIIGKSKVLAGGSTLGVGGKGGVNNGRNKDDSHLPAIPTRIVIDNQPLIAPRGRFANLTLDIDAKNRYIVPGDNKLTLVFKNSLAIVRAQGALIGGKIRITVDIPETASKGESKFDVVLSDPSNGLCLTATGTIKVVEPRKGKPGKGNKRTGNDADLMVDLDTYVQWLYEKDWADTGSEEPWDSNFPGECTIRRKGDEICSVTFKLNADFAPISKMRSRMAAKSPKVFDRKLNEYGEALCKALLNKELGKMASETSFSVALADLVFEDVGLKDLDDEDDADSGITVKRGILADKNFDPKS